ncbi:hypothetical protein BZG36_01937 [Bifiguratus adelaidae]|uniref:Endoribonuclease YSH1 n=1 Tax=Bifiguratus adelaidae TaxID=1938954 RepID=A0A261Y3S2_9FUNG|nr:hypothetical protein BZG36_01937 [Bifiguratus adelaidae]
MAKRPAELEIPVADENDLLQITPLGAGNEVGRSSILVQYKGKTVLLDAGVHPAYDGLASLPFFDEMDPSEVDLLLVTQQLSFGSCGVSTLFYGEGDFICTSFKGRVFMTHPTKAIYKWLLSDFIRVSNLGTDDQLYTEDDLQNSFQRIEAIDYHQQVEVEGIKFTAFNAGHVLGAAMFLIEIAGVKILYTGDYSREEDRHLMAAEKPEGVTIDVLITESTYGVQSHEPRIAKENRFTALVKSIVTRGGRCLMPVYALGRSQELLLILDEFWSAHPELDNIPIYFASNLAKKCIAVYQTYINMMNERIRKQFAVSNPFIFKHISNLRNADQFEDSGPCVMMASPGMLQSGFSRELFERWAPDKRNGLVVTGYSVDGTLAKSIINEPQDFTSMDGRKITLRSSVDYISFSAHVDYTQNSAFIDEISAPHVVLVHGEANTMGRLKSALHSRFVERDKNIKIHTPRNCDTVSLHFRGEKMAKTIGSLAAKYPTEEQPLSGILVSKDYQMQIMSPDDLSQYSGGLVATVITQRLWVGFWAGVELLRWHLVMMFGEVEDLNESKDSVAKTETTDGEQGNPEENDTKNVKAEPLEEGEEQMTPNGTDTLSGEVHWRVFDLISIKTFKSKPHQLLLEWIGNPVNDVVADSVLAVVLSVESSPASVKATHGSEHAH